MIIHRVYKTLFIGSLRPQRGGGRKIRFFRGLLWLSLSTACYATTLLQITFADQYIAFSKMEGESLFSIKDFDGSLLTVFILTIGFMLLFFWHYVNVVEDYWQAKRRGLYYSLFLLYFFTSFIVFVFSKEYFLGVSIWG